MNLTFNGYSVLWLINFHDVEETKDAKEAVLYFAQDF